MLANPTFPTMEYHRGSVLSLLCSEWEEVGHTGLNHQQTKTFFATTTLSTLYQGV